MPYEPITQHDFQDESLLKLALTHSSCERLEGDNQRLEFLGDAVLDLIIAETLYAKFPEADEGALDRCRAGRQSCGAVCNHRLHGELRD